MRGIANSVVLTWLLVALGGSLGGCNWFHKTIGDIGETYNTNPVVQYPDEKPTAGNTANNNNFPPPIDLDKYSFPGDPNHNAYQLAIGGDNGDKSNANRNRLTAILMERSDRICAVMKSDIAGLSDTVNFSLGEITTVLGGVGAIVTGAGAARALAGSAAITNASRAQFNEVFYQNALKSAILRAIDVARAPLATGLAGHMKDSLGDYPVEAMIRDVNSYNDACSFYNGIVALAHSVDTQPDSAQSLIARIAALQQQIKDEQAQIDLITPKLSGVTGQQKDLLQSQINNLEQAKEFATKSIAMLTAQLTLVHSTTSP